jgi:hypothetical protein
MPFWKTRNASSVQIIGASVTSASYCSSLLLNEDVENGGSTGYSDWLETRNIVGPTSFEFDDSSTVFIISNHLKNFKEQPMFRLR